MAFGVGGEAGFDKKRVGGVLHSEWSEGKKVSMESRSFRLCRVVFLVLALMEISTATLSPAGINYEG